MGLHRRYADADARIRHRHSGPRSESAAARQRASAIDRVRPVPPDRRSLLRRGDGVLGELRHAADISGRRRPHLARHSRERRSPGVRLGAAQPRGRRRVLPRRLAGEELLIREGAQQPSVARRPRTCAGSDRESVPDPVGQHAAGRPAVRLPVGTGVSRLRDRSREPARFHRRPRRTRRDRAIPPEAVHERARLPSR